MTHFSAYPADDNRFARLSKFKTLPSITARDVAALLSTMLSPSPTYWASFQSSEAYINGAKHNPWTWAELALMEIVGGWGFQQSRWLASLSEEVLGMSLRKRHRLHQTLRELGLLEDWNPVYLLSLLRYSELEQTMFWTDEAFKAISQVVAQHWAETTAEN